MKMNSPRTVTFGPYVLDLRSAELRKFGTKVKMGEQAFQILRMLLETPGEMVTREELRAKLWTSDTFVDFDHGLNSAVQRLRDCLSDSAEKPNWVETVPRRGYRFVGQVEWSDDGLSAEMPSKPDDTSGEVRSDEELQPLVSEELLEAPTKAPAFSRRMAVLGGLALVLSLAAVPLFRWIQGRWSTQQILPIRSIAVLPLDNLSGDPGQEYFADGMTDEVITKMAKISALRITSRTSVMQYKKVHRPLREIAKELGVDGILEGSVIRTGNRVHLTAQLIRAASDTHLWAESFDRDLSELESLEKKLVKTVAEQVGVRTPELVDPERHINPKAHDFYLWGRSYWFASEYEKSRGYFQKAIDLQPDYAAAWSGLADSYSLAAVEETVLPQTVMPQAEKAARKALELDDSAAEAHNSMAMIQLFYRWNWAEAEKESARAVELNPNLEVAHFARSYALRPLNRMEEALQEEKKAMELDPFSEPGALVYILIRMRRFNDALNEARVRSDAQPNNAELHDLLSYAYFCNGMEKESEEESERSLQLAGEKDQLAEQAQVYRRGGFRSVLEWRVDVLKRKAAKQYVSPLEFTDLYAQLGRKEETIRYLEESYRKRAPHLVFLQSHPGFDFLHSDPRYRAIVSKMGL